MKDDSNPPKKEDVLNLTITTSNKTGVYVCLVSYIHKFS